MYESAPLTEILLGGWKCNEVPIFSEARGPPESVDLLHTSDQVRETNRASQSTECRPSSLNHAQIRTRATGTPQVSIRLPRTTERPVRERGDECSELPAREVPQSHGRKSVVRGLPTGDVHESATRKFDLYFHWCGGREEFLVDLQIALCDGV